MFPKRFKRQLEVELKDVEIPDDLWLTFSVCGVQEESCGWEGWVLECLKLEGKNIEGDTILLCPKCSQPLFRTAASVKYIPSENQEPALVPGVDYDVVPMEYK